MKKGHLQATFVAFAGLLSLRCGSSSGETTLATTALAATAGSSLVPSTTLSQAVGGRIIAATGPTVAGVTRGEAAVGDDGSASYKLPIWVPDGVNALAPSLSIAYNSRMGRGTLGKRWTVSGLSVITRCAGQRAIDGQPFPVVIPSLETPGSEAFCLDGRRTVRVTGTPFSSGVLGVPDSTGSGEFRLPINPTQKIVANVTDSKTGVLGFKVFQPDGRIFYYGQSASSRLTGFASNFSNPRPHTTESGALAYYLDRIQDRFGNTILITYLNADPAGNTTLDEPVPAAITWGDVGSTPGKRRVDFNYTGTFKDPTKVRYVDGNAISDGLRLQFLTVSGPDATGASVFLKRYNFAYSAPTITGEQLLSSITECDGQTTSAGVSSNCRAPDVITWEAGSTGYLRTTTGITDPADVATQRLAATNGSDNYYKRMLVVDLNNDGRDDIVYRHRLPALPNDTCLRWVARLSQSNGTFGSPITLDLGNDSDPWCNRALPPGVNDDASDGRGVNPTVSDPIFIDLNRDGYPEIISPAGRLRWDGGSHFLNGDNCGSMPGDCFFIPGNQFYKYNVYRNVSFGTNAPGGGVGFFGFGQALAEPQPLTQPNASYWGTPTLTLGDIDGDGRVEFIRPLSGGAPGALWASPLDDWGSAPPTTIPPLPGSMGGMSGLSVMDLDGDGRMEILRDLVNSPGKAQVESATMSGTANIPPLNPPPDTFGQPVYSRWLLDLNGDGLLDIAYVQAGDSKIYAQLSTGGNGFTNPVSTTLPAGSQVGSSWIGFWQMMPNSIYGEWTAIFENGGRTVDMNRDGRADIVLVDNGADATGKASRTKIAVLLSKGDGTFSVQGPPPAGVGTVAIGDTADGLSNATPLSNVKRHGYRTTVAGDFDGNGLPDFAQMESGQLVVYFRQGFEPDVVTRVEEAKSGSVVSGRTAGFGYTTPTNANTYTSDPSSCQGSPGLSDHDHVSCLTRGMLLTSFLVESAGGFSLSKTYTYTNGLSDRNGLGFLGFQKTTVKRASTTLGTVATTTTKFSPGLWNALPGMSASSYVYPLAFRPLTKATEVDTPQGPNSHHETVESTAYAPTPVSISGGNPGSGALGVYPFLTTRVTADCPPQASGTCATGARVLSQTNDTLTYDPTYGTLQIEVIEHLDGQGNTMEFDFTTQSYYPADTTNWLINSLQDKYMESSTPGGEGWPTESRYETFTLDSQPNANTGRPTGAVASATTYAADSPMLVRTFGRDTRGRLTLLTEQDAARPAYEARTTGYQYQDADGVYVTTTTNTLGHASREWRHPGLGVVVERDDPNGVATAASFDSFGRQVTEIAAGGGTVQTIAYKVGTTPGMDVVTTPEGKTTRAVTVHLDQAGKEVSRTTPIDATKSLVTTTVYDPLGRAASIQTASKSGTTSTTLNIETINYDNLGRKVNHQRLGTDNVNRMVTFTYDGTSTTEKDESNRTTTLVNDAMGRASTQTALINGAASTANYSYGPFSELQSFWTDDLSTSTEIAYDAVGRAYYTYRTGMGARTNSYNAFGELMGSVKQDTQGTQVETATYVRDQLGRTTLMITNDGRAPSFRREFDWDTVALGKGKLGRIVDIIANNVVSFAYDGTGQPKSKTWQIGNLPFPFETWVMGFGYDSIGRLDTLTYPQLPTETTALSVKHGYDAYTGDVTSLTDTANTSAPLWQVTARNGLGEATNETMRMPGTTATGSVTRVNDYFLQSGQLKQSTFTSGTNSTVLSYTYQPDGLAATKAMSGVGGSWKETFDYDNLSRLTSWTPAVGSPVVTYTYNSGGDLVSRKWSGETTSYSALQLAQSPTTGAYFQGLTVTDQRGAQTTSDVYAFDLAGRLFGSPAASIAMNDDDQIGTITEKSNGQVDTLIYDASGKRIMTLYGANGSAGSLVTLDGMFELKRDAARTSSTTVGRCRLQANGKVIGDVVRTGTGQRKGTFYLEDNVHSVVAEAAPDGTLSARARRDAFGNAFTSATTPFLSADPGAANPDGSSRWGFGGHDRDNNWGLVDMLARSYSPRLGRFAAPDSVIGDPFDRRDHNPFSYVRNNPVTTWDPTGHEGEEGELTSAAAASAEAEAPYQLTSWDGSSSSAAAGADTSSFNAVSAMAPSANMSVASDAGSTTGLPTDPFTIYVTGHVPLDSLVPKLGDLPAGCWMPPCMLPDMSLAPGSAEWRGDRLVLSDLPTIVSPFGLPAVTMSFGEAHSIQGGLGLEESTGFMVDTQGGVAGYVQAGGRWGFAAGVSEGVQLGLYSGTVLDQSGLYVGGTVEAGFASFGLTNSGLSLGLGVGNMEGITTVMGATHVMPIVEPWQFESKLNYNMMITPLPNNY